MSPCDHETIWKQWAHKGYEFTLMKKWPKHLEIKCRLSCRDVICVQVYFYGDVYCLCNDQEDRQVTICIEMEFCSKQYTCNRHTRKGKEVRNKMHKSKKTSTF